MLINLNKIPVMLITIESAKERHNNLNKLFDSIGFTNVEHINGKILDKTNLSFQEIQIQKSSLVAEAHIEALKKYEPPFLILEDDIDVTPAFNSSIELPDDADAYYLGSSIWGMLNGVSMASGTRGIKITKTASLIQGMLGIHSILYITKNYVNKTIENLEKCIQINRYCDECIAEDLVNNKIYCHNYPMFYQKDGHNDVVTSIPMEVYLK
jgi:hypothetical protein